MQQTHVVCGELAHCSLVPRPHPAFHCFTVVEAKESWTEPGYEAKLTAVLSPSYVTSTKVEVYNNGKMQVKVAFLHLGLQMCRYINLGSFKLMNISQIFPTIKPLGPLPSFISTYCRQQ